MRSLEESDPDVWENFMSGDFVVQKSDIPFTSLFTDQALEQEIKILKRHGGIKGVTQDENVLDRLVATMHSGQVEVFFHSEIYSYFLL